MNYSDTMSNYGFKPLEKKELKKILKLINSFKQKAIGIYKYCRFLKAGYICSTIQRPFLTSPLLEKFIDFNDQIDNYLLDTYFEIEQCKRLIEIIINNKEVNTKDIEEVLNLMERISQMRLKSIKIIEEEDFRKKYNSEYNSEQYREQIKEKVGLIKKRKK